MLQRAQQNDICQLTCNVSVHLNMHASILNSVPAVHLTVQLYGLYYRLKKCNGTAGNFKL